jgi:hypothetical protein
MKLGVKLGVGVKLGGVKLGVRALINMKLGVEN